MTLSRSDISPGDALWHIAEAERLLGAATTRNPANPHPPTVAAAHAHAAIAQAISLHRIDDFGIGIQGQM